MYWADDHMECGLCLSDLRHGDDWYYPHVLDAVHLALLFLPYDEHLYSPHLSLPVVLAILLRNDYFDFETLAQA